MEVIGYALVRRDGPIHVGYLPLADLTIVIGANDAGKTRLLAGLVAHLRGKAIVARGDAESGVFFLRLRAEEAARLDTSGDLVTAAAGPPAARLRRLAGEPSTLRDALARSTVFAVVPPLAAGAAGSAYRCIDPEEEAEVLDGDSVRKALATELELGRQLRADVTIGMALWAPNVPLAFGVVPVDQLPPLPLPVALPVASGELIDEAVAAIESLVAASDLIERPMKDFDPEQSEGDYNADIASDVAAVLRSDAIEQRPANHDVWFETSEPDLNLAVRRKVVACCAAMNTVANVLLPRFISTEYEISVEPQLPSPFRVVPPIAMRLRQRATGHAFDLEQSAEGFRLWVQLAIFEGVDALRSAEGRLWLLMEKVVACGSVEEDRRIDLESARDVDDPNADWEERAHEDAATALEAALSELYEELDDVAAGRPTEQARPDTPDQPAALWDRVAGGRLANRLAFLRPRIYIIDEPERHLHPRVQREAAAWLVDAMRERRSQCIVATHAVPFLNLAGDVSYALVRRTAPDQSQLEVFRPELLTALDEAAAELGYNRGELLATVRLLVFVEGRADQKVLEALFLKRLFHVGIAVFPLHGAVTAKAQVLDSDVLLRYTRAKVAVLLDELSIEEIARLQSDALFLEEAVRSKKTTLNAMAQLLKNAKIHGRDVEPFGIPGHDIFDMLDEDVLREAYPKFPGHAAAIESWKLQGNEIPRKKFYEQQFDMPQGVDTLYVPIADRMRESARIPESLVRVIDDIERYALID